MGLFFGKKQTAPGQPRKDWPWTLTVGPAAPRSLLSWKDIQQALKGLIPDGDSFVILNQEDPKNPKQYWYIQSAIALEGPHKGEYVVGYGWSTEKRAEMWERLVPSPAEVLPYFERAWKYEPVDLTGFEDQSDWLPVNNK